MLIQKQDGVELTVGTHSKKWLDTELVYPVGEQELVAGHKGLRYFDNIVRGCDVHIFADCNSARMTIGNLGH